MHIIILNARNHKKWNRACGAVKSGQIPDEIVRFARDEIKSVLQPDEVGFHREAISSTKWIYPVRKDGFSWKGLSQVEKFVFGSI